MWKVCLFFTFDYTQNCTGMSIREFAEFAPKRAHEAYCKWQKVCAACMCYVFEYVWGADCASTASCRRKQFSQLLEWCPKLSCHRRTFLTNASALFYRAPQGFALSAALFQTWTRDKICSGAAPDWLRRQSRRVLVCLSKSVTGSRLNRSLFTEHRLCHLRFCGSKRSLLELSPRLTVFQKLIVALWTPN